MNTPPQHLFDFHGRYYGGVRKGSLYFLIDPGRSFPVER
jgi:hypothetical protein